MRGRIIATAIALLAGVFVGWAAAAYGAQGLLAAVAVLALVTATALWNSTGAGFRPRSSYAATPPERIRWPEARPIEPSGTRRRLLFCIHGFPSTPADFRKVAAVSDERGWDLAAPLLPGCGTEPKDFLSTEWSQYLAAVRDEWARLRPRYETACLVGISMGGALALALAEETCADTELRPAAMATVGAPAALNAWLRHGIVTSPLLYLARFLGGLVPSIGAALPDPARGGVDGDGDWKGYLGIYTRQTYTLQVGLRAMERRLDRVTCPILVCHGRRDKIVDFRSSGVIMAGVGSDRIEAYAANMDAFEHNRHNLVLYDSQRDLVWERVLDFFDRQARP